MANKTRPPFSYDPKTLERELRKYYLGPNESDQQAMLKSCGKKNLQELYSHIADDLKMKTAPAIGAGLSYEALADNLWQISSKNKPAVSFLGDGIKDFAVNPIVPFVCSLRGLTTAYTPYQPERSQGTLYSLWIYSSLLSQLTGMEAINASMYDRGSCLFEAMNTASKLNQGRKTLLLCPGLFPGDLEVLETMIADTGMTYKVAPFDSKTGRTDSTKLRSLLEKEAANFSGIVIPQINHFGVLEDVDSLVDLSSEFKLVPIGMIDPVVLGKDGLKPPRDWGTQKQGCTIIYGEAQHLAIAPNFGGPGLGLFGVRYNDKDKNSIRSTPGRYIGKGVDENGKPALSMVLSTREQHIRREKATSNICSNQSFLASLVGAALLARGEQGLQQALQKAQDNCQYALTKLLSIRGIEMAFSAPVSYEATLRLNKPVRDLIEFARQRAIHIGVDVSKRQGLQGQELILMSFSDRLTTKDLDQMIKAVEEFMGQKAGSQTAAPLAKIPATLQRSTAPGLPQLQQSQVEDFYRYLDKLNISPDNAIYPLGSCTMKYNPYINDWAAGLDGFTHSHPQAPEADVQGSLEILFHIQEMFKKITGLPGVTTQPVAGAQGELVGLKLFQAYHRDRKEKRDIILIPRSAHGTNPATATMAGFDTKMVDGIAYGIITIQAAEDGQIDMNHLRQVVEEYNKRISGIMVTNPNTSGVFETNFKAMADMVHKVGGLVYMDGANMNAVAGIIDLDKLGVDAVHNNLHKTWTIPHGGGGPGDAIVAVSAKLIPFLPGIQVEHKNGQYKTFRTEKCIGSFHRHFGNFAHKVRAYTYIKALGGEGVQKMSEVAVLSAVYLFERLKKSFPSLPAGAVSTPRMHEFILTLSPELFARIEKSGTPKANIIARIGKLFLDFGLHAPTVAFPEQFGLMIEPTESYTKKELDRFADIVEEIHHLVGEHPEVLKTVPHFTPVRKVNEVEANKNLLFSESLKTLPPLPGLGADVKELLQMPVRDVSNRVVKAHTN
jgi:glycine dehydrogenase